MFNFLKICGKGLLAILLSPLWLGFFLLVAAYGILLFIYMFFKNLFIDLHNLFVKDKDDIVDPLGDLWEDQEVLRIKKANEASLVQVSEVSVSTSSPSPAPSEVSAPTSTSIPSFSNDSLPLKEEEEPVLEIEENEKEGE